MVPQTLHFRESFLYHTAVNNSLHPHFFPTPPPCVRPVHNIFGNLLRYRLIRRRFSVCRIGGFDQSDFVLILLEKNRAKQSILNHSSLGKPLTCKSFSKTGPFDRVPHSGTCGENGSNNHCRLDRAQSGGPTAFVPDEKLKR